MHIAGHLIARFTDNTLHSAVASFDMVTHRVTYYNMPSKPVVSAELSVELNGHRFQFDFNYQTGKLTPAAIEKLLNTLYEVMRIALKAAPAENIPA